MFPYLCVCVCGCPNARWIYTFKMNWVLSNPGKGIGLFFFLHHCLVPYGNRESHGPWVDDWVFSQQFGTQFYLLRPSACMGDIAWYPQLLVIHPTPSNFYMPSMPSLDILPALALLIWQNIIFWTKNKNFKNNGHQLTCWWLALGTCCTYGPTENSKNGSISHLLYTPILKVK